MDKPNLGQWLDWLAQPGMVEALIVSALKHCHGAKARCTYCEQAITLDCGVGTGGVFDWHADGDYGCPDSPETSDEGVGGHLPVGVNPNRFTTSELLGSLGRLP